MKVILLERIEKVGKIGDIVQVKEGFGRNFLLPQKKALRATKENIDIFEKERKNYEKVNEQRKGEAQKIADKVSGLKISMIAQAQNTGVLYGSVNVRDIAEKLSEKGFDIPRSKIIFFKAIKEVGKHKVRLNLHPEVHCEFDFFVASTAEELSLLMNPEAHTKKEEKKPQPAQSEEIKLEEASQSEEEKSETKPEVKKSAPKKKTTKAAASSEKKEAQSDQ